MQDLNSADFGILKLTPDKLRALKPVKVLDNYDHLGNFHEDGLFSISIFGRVGDENRDLRFSYIDAKIEVLHPLIFRNVIKLKKFYAEIIKGNAYAIFDKKLKDFIVSDAIDGETGYNFFLTHWDDLKFARNESKQRSARIDFIDKWRGEAKTSKILVLPAGLRDIEVDPNGRDTEGEINEFYRRIISIANTLNSNSDINTRITDSARLGIQNAFNAIYSYVIGLQRGKRGFILRKWARRKVFNSTRTVLTSFVPSANNLADVDYPSWNNSTIGIAQLMKALLPVAVHKLSNSPLVLEAFPSGDNSAYLLDAKTLKRVPVTLTNKSVDAWTTQKGIEGLYEKFMDHNVRSSEVMIEGHYLGLVYKDRNGFKIVYDYDDADNYDWMDRDKLQPITWVEFVYLNGYADWNTYPIIATRYPVSGAGSIFPSYVYVKTTVTSELRYEFSDDGEMDTTKKALVYPVLKDAIYIDSQGVHPARLSGLGAD